MEIRIERKDLIPVFQGLQDGSDGFPAGISGEGEGRGMDGFDFPGGVQEFIGHSQVAVSTPVNDEVRCPRLAGYRDQSGRCLVCGLDQGQIYTSVFHHSLVECSKAVLSEARTQQD